jgi:putative heme-binding domain-containing protein
MLIFFLMLSSVLAQDQKLERIKLPRGQSDLERGEKLFQGHCALCHGTGGEGGRGPSLARNRLPRAADDTALVKVIEEGIAGTEMPGAWQMSPMEHRQVAAYVRRLGKVDPKPVPGDRARGQQIYAGKGACAGCHSINRQGSTMGPDLSEIGDRRSPEYLRAALIDPAAAVPESFRQVTILTTGGKTVTGMHLNEDSFSIQLRDYSGNLHSFWKTETNEIRRERGKSPMPSYKGALTESEVVDLVAFLVSLREVK